MDNYFDSTLTPFDTGYTWDTDPAMVMDERFNDHLPFIFKEVVSLHIQSYEENVLQYKAFGMIRSEEQHYVHYNGNLDAFNFFINDVKLVSKAFHKESCHSLKFIVKELKPHLNDLFPNIDHRIKAIGSYIDFLTLSDDDMQHNFFHIRPTTVTMSAYEEALPIESPFSKLGNILELKILLAGVNETTLANEKMTKTSPKYKIYYNIFEQISKNLTQIESLTLETIEFPNGNRSLEDMNFYKEFLFTHTREDDLISILMTPQFTQLKEINLINFPITEKKLEAFIDHHPNLKKITLKSLHNLTPQFTSKVVKLVENNIDVKVTECSRMGLLD